MGFGQFWSVAFDVWPPLFFKVDVDVVMSGGEWRYAAVSDNGPTLEPYFNVPRNNGEVFFL